eukprot:TRINITY_DN16893_c0_g1_i3.p1 TRINITY_DN16893_c0_g1~~TRINITY_DN16893_c0_g1_i3.p1  ORF type:complete len:365 (+),score=82.97 TRINITY_DN16893_c0_g1_i3:94-1188(+)
MLRSLVGSEMCIRDSCFLDEHPDSVTVSVALSPQDGFLYINELDLSICMLTRSPANILPVYCHTELPTLGQPVSLVHHPRGNSKAMCTHDCHVRAVGDLEFAFTATSDYGSSGAPVFDAHWRVIGVHVRGTHIHGLDNGKETHLAKASHISQLLVSARSLAMAVESSQCVDRSVSSTLYVTTTAGRARSYRTIGAAIMEASPGDCILLSSGSWRETVLLSISLSIKAESPIARVISVGDPPAIVCAAGVRARVHGIVVEQQRPRSASNSTQLLRSASVVVGEGADLEMSKCEVLSRSGVGVLVEDGARVLLSNCLVRQCKLSGVVVCLLYTSDAADEEDSVDLGGRRIIKKKKKEKKMTEKIKI